MPKISAIMLAMRNEQSKAEKKVRVVINGSMRMGKDERQVQDKLRSHTKVHG